MEFKLIWFDSFGAKSSCTLVKTKDVKILIDPGIAIMHSSFPASFAKKVYWTERGRREILKAAKEAGIITISHYHWDHFLNKMKIYENKILFVKNPNEYINDSQRKRALEFFQNIWKEFGKREIKFEKQRKKKFEDCVRGLKSLKKDFGDYQKRREELFKKGRKWFEVRMKRWKNFKIIPEAHFENLKIFYPEGKRFKFGKTTIKFTKPFFHGIEYSRVGWVFSTVIVEGKKAYPFK